MAAGAGGGVMIREFKSQYNPDLTLKSDKDEGASSATVVSAKKNKVTGQFIMQTSTTSSISL